MSVVDLPDPDSPTSASVRPARTSKPMPSTARTSPVRLRRITPEVIGKVFTRSVTRSTTGGSAALAGPAGAAADSTSRR
ncbi:Uncharacterised protein [Mycobacteroides abscessus subsp. abscessus]|nr:Uncharacterised protein [Mycobacteroides abscessus subsp. abscessus]